MIEPGAVLQIPALGVRAEIRATGDSTGGAYEEADVVGRARGSVVQPHVHLVQTERHEVIDGETRLRMNGREHERGPGQSMEVPPGVSHTQLPGKGSGEGRVRVRLTPAGDAVTFLARLADMSAHGSFNRFGFPRPVAGAHLIEDFAEFGHASRPPLP